MALTRIRSIYWCYVGFISVSRWNLVWEKSMTDQIKLEEKQNLFLSNMKLEINFEQLSSGTVFKKAIDIL